jgi:hypothetical protein
MFDKISLKEIEKLELKHLESHVKQALRWNLIFEACV